MKTVLTTDLPLKPLKRGKVRDNYEIDRDRVLMVVTDRISCFDVILPDAIPGKGRILNQTSMFWFLFLRQFRGVWKILDHFLDDDIWNLWIERVLSSKDVDENDLVGRSMIVQKMDAVIPIECVIRSVLTGSAWKEYREIGTVCGEKLQEGLKEGHRLPNYLFTPATKAETGHDQNISQTKMAEILAGFEVPEYGMLGEEGGKLLAEFLKKFSYAVFFLGRMYAGPRGIDIRDTKFEFGFKEGNVTLIDELLTPDSSRFALKDSGSDQWLLNYDKQLARDWLEQSGWNKEPPAPRLPDYIVQETSRRYEEIYRRLTGKIR